MITSFSRPLTIAFLTLSATAAAAQNADLCGGPGENGQWLGGDEMSSDLTTASSYVEQMALVLLRNEYVGLFTISEPGDYRIEAEGRGGGDTVIDLRNAAGDLVGSDDDGGGNAASRLETFLEPDTYCVSMRSFDGTPLTGFVRAGRTDTEALTAGLGASNPTFTTDEFCSLDNAQPLTLGEPVSNSFAAQNSYALILNEPTAISVTAENEDADPVLILYDENGNWLAENDDYDGLNSRIDMQDPLPAGTYCVSLDLYGDESLPITVTAKEYDPQEVLLNLYAQGEASPPLDGSYPVSMLGKLQARAREDLTVGGEAAWYAFDVLESGVVVVEAIAQGPGDPVLTMYDDLGRQVGYNDDSNGTLNSLLTVRVQTGTYLVAVRQVSNTTQGFVRLVFERYVPAQP